MSPVAVAGMADLSPGVPLAVEVPETDLELALVLIGDQVYAIRNQCSHARVPLSEGDVDQRTCAIECYLHGSQFDLRTGAALNLPATRPVPVYPCQIDDDQVIVDIDNPN